MIQDNPKDKDVKKEKEDSSIKPDPETLGPDPEEHMKGPISSIVRKIGEEAEENDEKDSDEKEEEND
ncbi:hypothetical protein L3C95_11645 [Chitinophaga filiformis]|uniref:hypothetical protein n=1 Tax=Chitinophaga filiformis TaxID=104663 RepID=UPI001F2EB514|nr:hypothetical protein [Chitinophaga filiformis]MCF6402549.1 hypothetical protein [Chitinophaga filiformis]MCF6403533.1 hypothetical protein [Chitinophaga filiformis]